MHSVLESYAGSMNTVRDVGNMLFGYECAFIRTTNTFNVRVYLLNGFFSGFV